MYVLQKGLFPTNLQRLIFLCCFTVFEPDGPMWLKMQDPEDGVSSSPAPNAELQTNNHDKAATAGNAATSSKEAARLEPPSPSKPANELSACLERKT